MVEGSWTWVRIWIKTSANRSPRPFMRPTATGRAAPRSTTPRTSSSMWVMDPILNINLCSVQNTPELMLTNTEILILNIWEQFHYSFPAEATHSNQLRFLTFPSLTESWHSSTCLMMCFTHSRQAVLHPSFNNLNSCRNINVHIVIVLVTVIIGKQTVPCQLSSLSVLDIVTVIMSFPFRCCESKFQKMPSEPQRAACCCAESEKFTRLFCYSLNPRWLSRVRKLSGNWSFPVGADTRFVNEPAGSRQNSSPGLAAVPPVPSVPWPLTPHLSLLATPPTPETQRADHKSIVMPEALEL